jgi:hypothetical protein
MRDKGTSRIVRTASSGHSICLTKEGNKDEYKDRDKKDNDVNQQNSWDDE